MLTVPPASLTRSVMLTSPSPLPRSSELRDIESLAIVGDRDLRVVAGAEQPNVGPAGAGMRDDVAQRFLRDPVQAERDLRGDGREVPFRAARQHGAVRALELGTVGGQCGHQPGVPQHRGMQVVGEVTDVLRERGRALREGPADPPAAPRSTCDSSIRCLRPLKAIDSPASCWLTSSCRSRAIRARSASWASISRPARCWISRWLDLERGPALANPLFGIPAFGDVDVAADVTREAAVRSILRNARGQNPSVGAVGSAEPVLQEEWRARLERRDVDAGEGSRSSGWTASNQPSSRNFSIGSPVNSAQVRLM